MSHNEEMTIDNIGRLVYANASNPGVLAELNVKVAGYYAFLTGEYIKAKFAYAKFYDAHKIDDTGKKMSDKCIEMLWLLEDEGQNWYTLKKQILAFEKMMSAIKTTIITANNEMKNI